MSRGGGYPYKGWPGNTMADPSGDIHSGGAPGHGESELEWNEKYVQTHGWPGLKHE